MYTTFTDRKIRIAIVGYSRISRNHFDSVEKHAGSLKLMAICDNNSEVLEVHSHLNDMDNRRVKAMGLY